MTPLHISVRDRAMTIAVDPDPPLGWRFWTFAGFPADPVEPRPYGGSRGIPLAFDDDSGCWVVAMERDDSFQLFTPHELFPCADQVGAAAFGRRVVASRAAQPDLFL